MNKTKATIVAWVLVALITQLICSSYGQTGSEVTIHFIDVGQGDCIFIDTSEKDVLIDAGPKTATRTVLDYLKTLNITHIDIVIATHAHEDHIGGLVGVINSNLTINTVLFNNQTHTSVTYTNFVLAAQTHNLTVAERGEIYPLTETTNMIVLNPVQPNQLSDQNDNSIVTKLQVGNVTFLFTGDAEEPAGNSMLVSSFESVKCDVLKIGHHGSKTATSQTFLDIVDPTYAIISAGLDNKYNHPHNETLQKLETKNITTYCTIRAGTIIVQTNGSAITFLENPEPLIVPEIPEIMVIPVFVVTIASTILCKQKISKTTNKSKRINPAF